MPKPSKPDDFRLLLDHARGLFIYHAGQRLVSIRYFFATYAIFAASYFATFAQTAKGLPYFTRPVLAGIALLVTVAFWLLDLRNAEMVEIDEDAAKEIEAEVAKFYELDQFNMTRNWESQERRKIKGECRQKITKYKFIVSVLFLTMSILSVAAIIYGSSGGGD